MLLLAVYEPQNWIPGTEALLSRPKVEIHFIKVIHDGASKNVIGGYPTKRDHDSRAISNPKVVTASLMAHHVLYVCKSS